MKTVAIIGAFGFQQEKQYSGGQPTKTRQTALALQEYFGLNQIFLVETLLWKKNPFSLLIKCWQAFKSSRQVILMPAQKGITVLSSIFTFFNIFYQKPIHYFVIGGWLPLLSAKKKCLKRSIKKFKGIYVETETMKTALQKQGFNNVIKINNFRDSFCGSSLTSTDTPLRVVFFSRVLKEKGAEDAIYAVREINSQKQKTAVLLDIYGPIDKSYEKDFLTLVNENIEYVSYCGVVDPKDASNILQPYFLHLFPTHFYTEGIPGSIIDGYFSGIPVLASRWESFNDVVEEGSTGFGYRFGDFSDFVRVLGYVIENPTIALKMKEKCLQKSKEYTKERFLATFIPLLETKENL